jgi:hypothetical protein
LTLNILLIVIILDLWNAFIYLFISLFMYEFIHLFFYFLYLFSGFRCTYVHNWDIEKHIN